MKATTIHDTRGTEMFARYAHAPNTLGYCGPTLATRLRDGSADDIRHAAGQFSGAWPYLQVLAKMTGIGDPLDYRLVESYWLGGGIGERLDPHEFTAELLKVIAPQAGHYWNHLDIDLASETSANHNFHVFGVYPWSRLLGHGNDRQPLSVLDSCRIGWGTVVSRDGTDIGVSCRRLEWDQRALSLSKPVVSHLDAAIDGDDGLPLPVPGDRIAIHWNRICGVLSDDQIDRLTRSTQRQLDKTNARIARR